MGMMMSSGYYGGDMGSGVADVAASGSFNWVLLLVILGSIALGIICGILLGKRAMKKRDVL